MLIEALTSKHQFSSVFYNRMFDEIRQSRDALKPDSKSANMVETSHVLVIHLYLSIYDCGDSFLIISNQHVPQS